jgi:hypothetical protein
LLCGIQLERNALAHKALFLVLAREKLMLAKKIMLAKMQVVVTNAPNTCGERGRPVEMTIAGLRSGMVFYPVLTD